MSTQRAWQACAAAQPPDWYPGDRVAARILAGPGESATYRVQVSKLFAAALPESGGLKILDVGCGEGRMGQLLARFRPDTKVLGAEVRPRTWRGPGLPQIQFDGLRLPFGDRELDVAMACDVLHHLRDLESVRSLLAEMIRVTRSSILIKDHLCASGLDRWKLLFLDLLGNLGRGVPVSGRYLPEGEWSGLFDLPEVSGVQVYREVKVMAPLFSALMGDHLQVFFRVELAAHRPA